MSPVDTRNNRDRTRVRMCVCLGRGEEDRIILQGGVDVVVVGAADSSCIHSGRRDESIHTLLSAAVALFARRGSNIESC